MSDGHGVDIEPARELPGEPDGFQRLWTPHRAAYISGQDKPADGSPDACPFCSAPRQADEQALIVARGEHCFALLNLYPYNSGHLLVCTYRHVSMYTDLTEAERIEMGRMTARAMEVLAAAMSPDGFNLGMNQGQVAGAGIATHIHQHIVPRWSGDANFLPIVARTKAVPAILSDTRSQLARAWESIEGQAHAQ
ncbi:MAG: HIT domain-containing protein [Actinomycetaceae bacterium]|nr:HIT domain-containing protein [Actinomycetaceae bacterium]